MRSHSPPFFNPLFQHTYVGFAIHRSRSTNYPKSLTTPSLPLFTELGGGGGFATKKEFGALFCPCQRSAPGLPKKSYFENIRL